MTLREATALVRLYEACQDEDLRRWALTQVPELGDIVRHKPNEEKATYRIMAYGNDRSYPLGGQVVRCYEKELEDLKRKFRDCFVLATNVRVEAVPL